MKTVSVHGAEIPALGFGTYELTGDDCRRGMTRFIGLSNFTTKRIDEAVALSDLPLVTNQVEYHPFLDHTPVFAALRRHGMSLTAYSPLAHSHVVKDPKSTVMVEFAC